MIRVILIKTCWNNTLVRLLAVATFCIIAATIAISYSSQTHASDISGFNPGNIISDAVFFDNTTMSANDIQTFLNSKVATCDTNGTATASEYGSSLTHAQYAAAQGWSTPPYTCLKDYSAPTPTEQVDSYCNGYSASTSQTSAQIIYGIAASCGINPRVLLVLLQKEQGLVTDTWPISGQYQKATGYACPDTSGCDSTYYGLFNQVYFAARQFKIYKVNPSNYSYTAGRNNNVLYNPNSSCRSSTVYIQNQATAGLYNYTPYQPNQATLNWASNGGSPPSSSYPGCGAFGNINFYTYFTNWFGSTFYAPVSSLILSNGTYTFTNVASGKSLDVAGGSSADGTPVQLYQTNGTNAQNWTITLGADGYYTFMNQASGKYLDAQNGSTLSGTPLQIFTGNGSCAQEWSILTYGVNTEILNKCSDLAIDVTGGNLTNGTRVQEYTSNSSPSQIWYPMATSSPPLSDGIYSIASIANLNMDIASGATTDGTPIQIYSPNTSDAQIWQLNKQPNGFYTLRNPATNKYIVASSAGTGVGTGVQLSTNPASCSQQWSITQSAGSTFAIRSACSLLVIDVPNGAVSTSGTNLQLYTNNLSGSQQWSFSPLASNKIPSGIYSVRSASGLTLDISGGSQSSGARTQLYTVNYTAAQDWQFIQSNNGTYLIYNPNSGKYLNVRGGSVSAGSEIQIFDNDGTCAVQWNISRNDDGSYIASSACSSGYVLDVIGGAISTVGTKLQLFTANGTLAQHWFLNTP